MSAVVEIQTAIDKLTQARTFTHGGKWIVDPEVANIVMRPDDKHPNGWDGVMMAQTSDGIEGPFVAELIVTLHATIDAQLIILRAGMPDLDEGFTDAGRGYHSLALVLARAINGGIQ